MKNNKNLIWIALIALAGVAMMSVGIFSNQNAAAQAQTNCITFTVPDVGTITFCPLVNSTDTPAPTDTDTPPPTQTSTVVNPPTNIPQITETVAVPTGTQGAAVAPFVGAPACDPLPFGVFHTLWNSVQGCHYDHEHGTNPFTPEVAAAFPGFDLRALLGGVGVGHTNPSSPMENTHKHGGFKWDVMLANPHGCIGGFESARYCVQAAVIEYHAFGNYAVELDARVHSTVALLKVCDPARPTDCGYLFNVQHQDYGQVTSPYQGTVITFPNSPAPAYASGFGPYFTVVCLGNGLPGCRASLAVAQTNNSDSKWTSKATGRGERPPGSNIFRLLFDVRDVPQVLDASDLVYPYTFRWLCTNDGGLTFDPTRCKYNNTTTKVNEVTGVIPVAWDNLAGFDTNPAVGRVTAEGYTDRYGNLKRDCTQAGGECFPLKLVNMFVGAPYGDYLTAVKASRNTPDNTPERDICANSSNVIVNCDLPGAIPLGWPGADN